MSTGKVFEMVIGDAIGPWEELLGHLDRTRLISLGVIGVISNLTSSIPEKRPLTQAGRPL